jgi:zinc transport system substrate-binding protein
MSKNKRYGGSIMKRYFVLILNVLLFASLLTGCGQSSQSAGNKASVGSNEKLNVVTTIFAPYDFSRELTGDKGEVTMLLPPASESHSYEPTPQDIIRIQNCDIFIYVGGESDEWVKEVLESMDTGKMKVITLTDCVEPVVEEHVEGMEEEEEEPAAGDASEPEYDEHVWTSPKNAKLIIRKLADAFCEADSANASAYQQNAEAYLSELDELDAAFQEVVDSASRRTVVFGDRFPFRYLADAYGLDYYAAFPGCSTETEASAATVKFLIDKIKEEKIPVVFHIELSNEAMANTISEATGAKVLLLHAVHNITKADFENEIGYIDLMKQNVKNLKEALS